MVVKLESELSENRYRFKGTVGPFRLGDNSRECYAPHFANELFVGSQRVDAIMAAPESGAHTATAKIRYSVHRGKRSGGKRSTAPISVDLGPSVFEAEQELEAIVQVLASDAPNPVIEKRDDAISGAMADCFRPVQVAAVKREFGRSGIELTGFIMIDTPPPVPVAFDVFVLHGGLEYAAGNFVRDCASNGLSAWGFSLEKWEHGNAEPVNIVLRANPRLAEETTDIFEVWVGELTYADIPVGDTRQPPPRPDMQKLMERYLKQPGRP